VSRPRDATFGWCAARLSKPKIIFLIAATGGLGVRHCISQSIQKLYGRHAIFSTDLLLPQSREALTQQPID
jgi:hypothetical protein